jgi:hypothetical protein
MPQVIVKAAPDAFYYALETNKGRRDIIRTSCHDGADVTLKCAQEYHRLMPSAHMMPVSGRSLTKARQDWFHKHHCHIRLCKEGDRADGGFVVLSGELLGLHNVKPGTGDWMMREAVSLGADRLDTFDIPHLIALYKRHGFREVLREPNTTKGKPDVVWMRRVGP